MLRFLMNLFNRIEETGDMSKHRVHTTKYQDLCM